MQHAFCSIHDLMSKKSDILVIYESGPSIKIYQKKI